MEIIYFIVQIICLLVIFKQISQIKLATKDYIYIILSSLAGIFLLKTFFYLIVCGCLYFICISEGLQNKKYLAFFYSIYTLLFIALTENLSLFLSNKFFPKNFTAAILITILPVIINYIISKLIRPDLNFLRDNYAYINIDFLIGGNILLFILCILQFGSYFGESYVGDIGLHGFYLTSGFCILMLLLLFYLHIKIQLIKQVQLQKLKDEQIQQLTQYAAQIEELYNEIRNVRHDYINIISSLKCSIEKKNIDEIENVYNSVLSNLGGSLQSNKYDLINLSKIKITAVKSLLSAKIIDAQNHGVSINIEISEVIKSIYIELLDYIRLLSILIDNAVEAAEATKNPEVSIAFITDQERKEQIIIIKNNTVSTQIDKRKIFESGVSTKGPNRGLGLSIVRDFLIKYPNISLTTQFKDQLFTQKIVIKEGL